MMKFARQRKQLNDFLLTVVMKALHDDLTVMVEMKKDSIEKVVNVVVDVAERVGMNLSKQKGKLI